MLEISFVVYASIGLLFMYGFTEAAKSISREHPNISLSRYYFVLTVFGLLWPVVLVWAIIIVIQRIRHIRKES